MEPQPQDKLPPKSVAESWIWYVFNPQVDYCAFELELLPRTLTYRSWRGFERLVPLRDALLPAGKTVFDDMQGELPEYDRLVKEHDTALSVVLVAAGSLFKSLVTSDAFAATLDKGLQALKESNKPSANEPGSLQDAPDWLAYEAEHVVNDLAPLLGTERIDHRLWNNYHDKLVAVAAPGLVTARDQARQAFGETIRQTREALIKLRRGLSRSLDIPLVPTR